MKPLPQWSPHEIAEYDAALQEAWDSSSKSGDRYARLVEICEDAIQAHTVWGEPLMNHMIHSGAGNALKNWAKRQERYMVPRNFGEVSKPRIIGVKRKDADGKTYHTQSLFEFLTLQELRDKLAENLTLARTFNENAAVCSALISFCEFYKANSVDEASRISGIPMQEWLMGATA
jgi:hypothetical protein